MLVVLNPFAVVSDDGRRAVTATDGRIHLLEERAANRIVEVKDGARPILPVDLPLLDTGLLVPLSAVNAIRDQVRQEVVNSSRQTGVLVVMPTERCNFRCVYCYETFSRGRMPDEIRAGVVRFLDKQMRTLPSYHLAWFGGEPLLQAAIVGDVTQRYRDLQSETGCVGTVSITTNGYLIREAEARGVSLNAIDVYQVTLDGPRSWHDGLRVLANGSGTYDRISENLMYLLETTRARLVLRINVDTREPDSAGALVRWMREDLSPRFGAFHDRVEYNVVPIWEADTRSIKGICLTDIERYQVWMTVKDEALAIEGTDRTEYVAQLISEIGGLACYAGKPNNFVVGSDGSVYKCTVAFDLPENQIGRLSPDGELLLDESRVAVWSRENSSTDKVCSSCAFSLSCQGLFCPLLRITTGERPCPTEKRFIDQFLGGVPEATLAIGARPRPVVRSLPVLLG